MKYVSPWPTMNLKKVANITNEGELMRVHLVGGGSFLIDFYFIDSSIEIDNGRFYPETFKGTLRYSTPQSGDTLDAN